MSQFLSNKPLQTSKKFNIFENSPRFHLNSSSFQLIEEEMDQEMNEYLFTQGDWKPSYHATPSFCEFPNNPLLGEILFGLIETLFPKKPLLETPEFPGFLPLKLAILGVPFAGKRTLAGLLKVKYGVESINPEDIIKEAINYAFPVEEVIDPKKPKKKVEKGDKKVEELVKEDPELRNLGLKAKEEGEGYSDGLMVEAILYKIRSLFKGKNKDEIKEEINEEKNKAGEKLKEMKKIQEETEKKSKKTISKAKNTVKKTTVGAPVIIEEVLEKTPEERLQELIAKNPFYYTKGFVLINFPRTVPQVLF